MPKKAKKRPITFRTRSAQAIYMVFGFLVIEQDNNDTKNVTLAYNCYYVNS